MTTRSQAASGGRLSALRAASLTAVLATAVSGCLFQGNDAKEPAEAVVRAFDELDPEQLCTNGDAGGGWGNITPWYTVYLEVADTTFVDEIARSSGGAAGFGPLEEQTPAEWLREGGQAPSGGESLYLVAGREGARHLTVAVYREESVTLGCSGDAWGSQWRPAAGRAVIKINLSLPPRR